MDLSGAVDKTTRRISPNGDLVLVVGPKEGKILVDSVILKRASAVFNTMLEYPFAGGQRLQASNGEAVEVKLPHDHYGAMSIIAQVLHFRSSSEDLAPTASDLLEIGITARKYELVKAVSFATSIWMDKSAEVSECKNVEDSIDMWTKLQASILLQQGIGFVNFSQKLINGHQGSFLSLMTDRDDEVISVTLALKLTEARQHQTASALELFLREAATRDNEARPPCCKRQAQEGLLDFLACESGVGYKESPIATEYLTKNSDLVHKPDSATVHCESPDRLCARLLGIFRRYNTGCPECDPSGLRGASETRKIRVALGDMEESAGLCLTCFMGSMGRGEGDDFFHIDCCGYEP